MDPTSFAHAAHAVPANDAAPRALDEASFEILYRAHARYVAGVVYRLAGNDADLDDVVQETFVAAAAHLDQLRNEAAARAWLVAIAVRSVKAHLARRRRWRLLALHLAEVAAQVSDPGARSAADDLYSALDGLPPDLRIPWVLSRVEDLTLAEVASACDASLATVKRRIREAERRIERRLAR